MQGPEKDNCSENYSKIKHVPSCGPLCWWRTKLQLEARRMVFKILLFIALILAPVSVFGADTYLGEVEAGGDLPDPYSCLSYQGRTSAGLGLVSHGCINKQNDWIPVPKISATKAYPEGFYATEFNGEILIFVPVKFNNVLFYRREP